MASLSLFFDLLYTLTAGDWDVSPILFRAGAEFIRMWLAEGPAHTFINCRVDFLRYLAGSCGYNTVGRGPAEEMGHVELTEVDEGAMMPRIEPLNLFSLEFARSVFLLE